MGSLINSFPHLLFANGTVKLQVVIIPPSVARIEPRDLYIGIAAYHLLQVFLGAHVLIIDTKDNEPLLHVGLPGNDTVFYIGYSYPRRYTVAPFFFGTQRTYVCAEYQPCSRSSLQKRGGAFHVQQFHRGTMRSSVS